MLPCSSRAIRSASSINNVPKPLNKCQSFINHFVNLYSLPDAGTSLDHVHEPERQSRRRATPSQYYILLQPLLGSFEATVQVGMYLPLNTSAVEAGQQEYHVRDLRMKGRSPNHRLLYNRVEEVQLILVVLYDVFHGSIM